MSSFSTVRRLLTLEESRSRWRAKSASAFAEAKERAPRGSYWRHHDGRWNYWNQADNRWYYTDGSNWYYDDGKKWDLYRFDKDFGRKDFEPGDYKSPGEGVEINLPRHTIYVGT